MPSYSVIILAVILLGVIYFALFLNWIKTLAKKPGFFVPSFRFACQFGFFSAELRSIFVMN